MILGTTTSPVRRRTRWKLSRAVTVAALISASVAVGTSSGCSAQKPKAHQLSISNFLYTPDTVVVAQGDTVTWTNDDFVPHTVTARDSSFDSQSINAGAKWSWVASKPGTHPYFCTFHPIMQGTIEVR